MSETLREAIVRVAAQLERAGIDAPRIEARRLVGLASGLNPAGLVCAENDALGEAARARLDRSVAERRSRRPLAHIEGWTQFYGLALKTDARALIPRNDSECVVGLALDYLPTEQPARIADLGTGTGCLLLALLGKRPLASGKGLDISCEALDLARENAVLTGLSARAHFETLGWADWTGWPDCDLIISNPPYIATGEIETLQPEVRDHEPRLALDGGADGLSAYRNIIAVAAARMRPGGVLVLETGHRQRAAVTARLQAAGFAGIASRRDLGGNDRALVARKA